MEEERRTLRLSDAFETDTGAGEYEWTATMININSGKNQSIMDSCHVLYEYAVFVAKIKRYRDSMELNFLIIRQLISIFWFLIFSVSISSL